MVVCKEDQTSSFTAWLLWSASDMVDEWHQRQMRAKPTNQRQDAPVVHGAVGGVNNLLQVWIYHQDWRECKWSQRAENEVCMEWTHFVCSTCHEKEWGAIFFFFSLLLKGKWWIQQVNLFNTRNWKQLKMGSCVPRIFMPKNTHDAIHGD